MPLNIIVNTCRQLCFLSARKFWDYKLEPFCRGLLRAFYRYQALKPFAVQHELRITFLIDLPDNEVFNDFLLMSEC